MFEIEILLKINLRLVLFLQNKQQTAAYNLITERTHVTHPRPAESICKIRSNEPRTRKGDGVGRGQTQTLSNSYKKNKPRGSGGKK